MGGNVVHRPMKVRQQVSWLVGVGGTGGTPRVDQMMGGGLQVGK